MDLQSWFKLTPLYDLLGKRSFSQSGEDMVVDSILGRPKKGFYVDIGAYHPKIFSNTYLFYKRGWRGICVEPNPEAKWKFSLVRPRDVFVNCGVSYSTRVAQKSVLERRPSSTSADPLRAVFAGNSASRQQHNLEYFVFEAGAVNTFSAKQAEENKKVGRKLTKIIKVPVRSMESLLDEYLPKRQKIDLLNVDVEGMDLAVLKSNNWKKYRPKVVICEEVDSMKGKVREYLEKLGYELVGMTGYSLIFKDKKPR